MENQNIKEIMNNLVDEILKHDKLDNEHHAEITDSEYDKMYSNLLELEVKYPKFVREDSPTQRIVYDFIKEFEKVKHSKPMLSLKKGTTRKDILNFIQSLKLKIKSCFIRQLKLDGLTIVLKYNNGKLIDAITRGDGRIGERVLHTVKTIRNIPKEIPFKGYLELRGEALMPFNEFERINVDGTYSNCRNLASGTIRQLNSKIAASRNLQMLIFELENAEGLIFKTDLEQIKFVEKLGFDFVPYKIYKEDQIEQLIYECEHFEEERKKLPYPIDGLVIKINDLENRIKLGYTNKHPRWALAFKFPSEDATTKLKRVEWQVGRTGKVTPVLIFDTIEIGGTNIKRATISNVTQLRKSSLKLLDNILIARSKDVIPKFIKNFVNQRNGTETEIIIPTHCPICNEKLTQIGADLYCTNDDCLSRITKQLAHFCSKEAMNIKGLGKNIINTLVDEKYIENISDIYKLNDYRDKLINLPKFGDKKVDNLLKAIEKSKTNSLTNVITGLGIPQLGTVNSKTLAIKYKTMDNFIAATKKENFKEELLSLPDIGDEIANSIISYFNEDNIKLINTLKEFGLTMEEIVEEMNISTKLEGMKFVITGTLSKERGYFKKLIQQNGGKVVSSVSKNTSYVLVGEDPGSKVDTAKELNVAIINEIEFLNLLK